jgi:competence protein ComEA
LQVDRVGVFATYAAAMPTAQDRLAALLPGATSRTAAVPVVEPITDRRRPVWRVALIAVCCIAVAAWANRPQVVPTADTVVTGVPLAAPSPVDWVVVDIEGDVDQPGLVRLPVGSRVADAIAAAGGLRKKGALGQINLAARLEDGQLLVIGAVALDGGTVDTRVSLNRGTAADFDTLPGVGPVLAARIVTWRQQHQHFSSIDELQEVPGIGAKVFQNLKPLVRL